MTRAEGVRDLIVERIDATGFVAHGLHVLAADDTAEHRWTEDRREDVHSVAKALCVFAAGIAEREGTVSLDAAVSSYLDDDVELGAGVEHVTLRHLLTMSSGIDLPWSETMMTDWPDLALEFLRRPSSGRVFQYSNASTYTAMTVLARRVGDIGAYVQSRVFDPLGIPDVSWERTEDGRVHAGGGVALRTEELARVGRLIRDRGVWHGQQLVPSDLVDAMHSDWVVAGANPGYDRYALAGWAGPGAAWRLHGAHGQLLIFSGDAVVTITADDHFGADAIAAFAVEVLEG